MFAIISFVADIVSCPNDKIQYKSTMLYVFAVCVIYIKSRLYILTVKCCLVCYKKNSHLVDVIIVIIAYNSTILAMYFFVSAYWVYSQESRHFKCTANAYANGCKHVLQCSYATDL